MSRIDLFIIGPVLSALVLCAAAEESRPPEVAPFKAPEAWMLDENRPRPDPHRRMSPEMNAISDHPDQLENLGAEDLAKMALDDPLLKYACADIFIRSSLGRVGEMDGQQELVLADLRRRGEFASPLLLKLIEENQETHIESSILGLIDYLGTVRLDPFLEYARKLLRKRPNSEIVADASGLLARQGTKEDIELLEWLLEQQPFVVTDVTKNLKALRERLNPLQSEIRPEPRSERRDKPSPGAKIAAGSANDAKNRTQEDGFSSFRTRPWIIGVLILVALFGLYLLVRKALRRIHQWGRS